MTENTPTETEERKVTQSAPASVELVRTGEVLSLSYCDAETWQWTDALADVDEFVSADDLVDEIAKSIEVYASDLARSIVKNAFKRGLLPESIAEPADAREGQR